MSNVYGSHPGGCERQTRGSVSVTIIPYPDVHDTASCLPKVALFPRRHVRLKGPHSTHNKLRTESIMGVSANRGAQLSYTTRRAWEPQLS